MKKIFLVLCLVSTTIWSQQFQKQWEKVIENESAGKVKTANSVVADIYKKASHKKDEAQIIKCFFYQSKYSQVIDEGAQQKIIANVKTEINQGSIPTKAILNFVYGKCLNDYYNANQYSLRNRTKIDSITADFLTWTKADFDTEIKKAYAYSIENEAVLKATPLTNYEAIFDYSTTETFQNKSLFDYLLDENINFYKTKINAWKINQNDFLSSKNNLLGNSAFFTKLNLDFVKNENLKTILALYQKKESNAPTTENQLERMQFVHKFLLKSDIDFLTALEQLQKNTTDDFISQKILLEKATLYHNLASKANHPDYNIKAIAVLDSITILNKTTNAYQLALKKKHEIKTKTLSVQLQKQLYNQENARAYISYKNLKNFKF